MLEQICLCPAVKIGMEKRESMIHEQRDRVKACITDFFFFTVEVIRLLSLKSSIFITKSSMDRFSLCCCPMNPIQKASMLLGDKDS